MKRLVVACLAFVFAANAPVAAASRGPATPEERAKLVELVASLEAEPRAEGAAAAREWLLSFLRDVPDITAKQCLSLLGTVAERQGIPQELLMQQLYSNAAYVVSHQAPAGSTEALLASVTGTLRAYEAIKAADAAASHPRLEELLRMEREGLLETHVRAQGRACR